MKFLTKLNLNKINSFDTITTKVLFLVLFTTIIPLFAITNLSIKIITGESDMEPKNSSTVTHIASIHPQSLQNKQIIERRVNFIMTLSIISLFVAIGFAILFSRKITTPVLNLVKAASSLSLGELDYRIKIKGNDEIAKLSLAFNKMAKNLQNQQRLRDNFIAALTHDLKVPMLAENQTINYLLKEAYGPITDDQKEVLELIKSTNNSSLEMVSTLLDVYKYDMGSEILIKEDFNLVDLLNESINQIKSLADEKNINITMGSDSSYIRVNADKRELKRVLHNLISNAINNANNKGEILCKAEEFKEFESMQTANLHEYEYSTLKNPICIKNFAKISIKDNGVGISKEDTEILFKRFSLNKGRKPAGTGIGLYYSHQVLSRHGGLIWVESTEGKGSVFSFIIPLDEEKMC